MGIRSAFRRIGNITAAALLVVAGLVSTPVGAIGEDCPVPFLASAVSNVDSNSRLVKAGDDSMWTKKSGGSPEIARITSGGSVSSFAIPSSSGGIAAGTDGNIWFTHGSPSQLFLSSITSGGTVSSTQVSISSNPLRTMTLGSDGVFWGVGFDPSGYWYVERIATNGTATHYPITTSPATPNAIIHDVVSGSDGNIWFDYDGNGITSLNQIVRVDVTNGSMTWFSWGAQSDQFLRSMTKGPDGALWYSVYDSPTDEGFLGRMTTSGSHAEFTDAKLAGGGAPGYLTSGSDGNLWFTAGDGLGRFTLNTHQIENYHQQTTRDAQPVLTSIGSNSGSIWTGDVSLNQTQRLDLSTLPPLATPRQFVTSVNPYDPTFTWQAVSGATSYAICRDGIVIDTTSNTTYADATATEAGHYYTVVAKDASNHQSSPAQGIDVFVDRALPVLGTPTLSADPLLHGQTSTLSVEATDSNDISSVRVSIDNQSPIAMSKACIGMGCSTPTDTWEKTFGWTGDADCGIGCSAQFTPLDDGVHTLTITAVDGLGREGTPRTLSLTVGLVPPATVSVVKTPTNTTPIINWSAVAGADHYVIYRDGGATPVATSATTSYTDTATLADGTHTYAVASADAEDVLSAQSSPVSVVVDKTLPTVSSPAVTPGLILLAGTLAISANAADSLSGVTGGEYYIDTDPGQGNATSMTYSATTGKISASHSVSLGSLSIGSHTVYMRSKDAAGNWSTTVSKTFLSV